MTITFPEPNPPADHTIAGDSHGQILVTADSRSSVRVRNSHHSEWGRLQDLWNNSEWDQVQDLWERTQAFRMVPASQATLFARKVRTQEEMGKAMRLLRKEAGLTIDQLTAKVAPLNIPGLRRSTIGRLCAGGSLCATREALEALVEACGVTGPDRDVWGAAWERARASQRPRGRPSVTAIAQSSGMLTGTAEDTLAARVRSVSDHTECDSTDREEDLGVVGDDDEVLGTWTVTFTRRHLQTAVVLFALFDLAATTSSTPGVRNAGAVVLGIAASIAMFEMICSTTSVPTSVPVAA